jgi:threonine synthase
LWRYAELLPLQESDKQLEAPVTLGEGWTPLVRARRLGKTLGLSRLYVKDESANPTQSVKARGMAAAVTRSLHLGTRVVSVAGTGETGTALATYAARAGLEAKVFLPRDTRPAFVKECALLGAEVTLVEGHWSEAVRAAEDRGRPHGWYNATSLAEPYRIEGEKTLGYELAEQLGWQLPDWIVYPTGAGTGVIAIWKAFAELAALGWIDPVRRPHLACVQAAGCAPLVRAFGAGAERAAPWDAPATIASGLRVPTTPGDFLVLRALRESAGAALAVGDTEMVADMKDTGRLEGIGVSPEGGAAVHAVRVLMSQGLIKSADTVIIVATAGVRMALDALQ